MTVNHSRVFKTAPRTGWFVGAVFLCLVFWPPRANSTLCTAAEPDQLLPVDGEPIQEAVESIADDAVKLVSGRTISLNDLRRIIRPSAKLNPADPNKSVEVYTAAGGRLFAANVVLKDDEFVFQSPVFRDLRMSIDDIRAVRFPGPANASFLQAVQKPDGEFDQFYAIKDNKVTSIQGYVEGISDTHVTFEWDDQSQQIPKSKTYGLVLAAIEESANDAKYRVRLADGSLLTATSLTTSRESQQTMLQLQQTKSSQVSVPWDAVVGIGIQSDRVVYLSELKPIKVEEESIAAFPRKWQRNRSITGGRLLLGDQSFSSGLGMQPLSTLTWDIESRFVQFNAIIGIDASAKGRGDCEFVVMGDGKELFRQRVRGSDPPRNLRIKVESIQQLSLIVEPGENLDFFDHANWCDACLIAAPGD